MLNNLFIFTLPTFEVLDNYLILLENSLAIFQKCTLLVFVKIDRIYFYVINVNLNSTLLFYRAVGRSEKL